MKAMQKCCGLKFLFTSKIPVSSTGSGTYCLSDFVEPQFPDVSTNMANGIRWLRAIILQYVANLECTPFLYYLMHHSGMLFLLM